MTTVIHNKRNKTNPKNYRPTTITSIICRVLKIIIATEITSHPTQNNLLNKNQHSFLPNKSTSTNVLETLNICTEAQTHNNPVDIVYLNYSKAFDSMPHQRLLNTIQSYGIPGSLFKWLKSYLTNRRQCVQVNCVQVNGAESKWRDILNGVLQGSVLGSILFNIYINN